MKIKVVLFDLDGTLLPMDLDVFMKRYMESLAAKVAPLGFEPKRFGKAIIDGIVASLHNSGEDTNENVFWRAFSAEYDGEKSIERSVFDEYYSTDFAKLKETCGFYAEARPTVDKIKEMGFRVALATNPVYPAVATHQRLRWAGFVPSDFELITTYEDSRYCKPNPKYFESVAASLGVLPEECLMVGNDTTDDMSAESCGMRVFLLTDCLINAKGLDITAYPHGDFSDLIRYVEEINK